MPRNVLFLDFDGVLNTGATDAPCLTYLRAVAAKKPNTAAMEAGLFNPASVAVLNRVIRYFDPEVVLSTQWMDILTPEQAQTLLAANGVIQLRLCAQCPVTLRQCTTRAAQIAHTLTTIGPCDGFLILDDSDSGGTLMPDPLLNPHVVWCDLDENGQFAGQGLQEHHVPLMANQLVL